jgi:hypothetical protein
MPREVRLEYPGAMYHVMSRGDRREDIFLKPVCAKMIAATGTGEPKLPRGGTGLQPERVLTYYVGRVPPRGASGPHATVLTWSGKPVGDTGVSQAPLEYAAEEPRLVFATGL